MFQPYPSNCGCYEEERKMILSSRDCKLHHEKSLRFHYRDFTCRHGGIKSHDGWKNNFSQKLFLLKGKLQQISQDLHLNYKH